jgi:DNA-binding winged helix-turn-helix (wHTH) protein/tetratricopeptide (TPR) repeat protein
VADARKFVFDGWSFDPDSGELSRGDRSLRLSPQPLAMLRELLARPGEVITRERMRELLWPDGVVDFDNGLNAVVRKLRVSLGDDAEAPRYIETLPRIGYRFIGPMGSAGSASAAAPVAQNASAPRSLAWVRRPRIFIAGLALLVAMSTSLWWFLNGGSPGMSGSSGSASVAARTAGTSEKAYDLFLQGKFHRSRRDIDGTLDALANFEAALAIDPYFADGWAELASTWAGAGMTLRVPVAEAFQQARKAALRSIELGDASGHGRSALAQILAHYDLDLRRAESALQISMQTDDQYARGWHLQALLRAYEGRMAEAFDAIRRARELEPMTLLFGVNYGLLLYESRRFAEAEEQARLLLASQPRFDQARSLLIRTLVARGDAPAALEQLPLRIADRPSVSDAGLVYAHLGRRDDALAEVERIARMGRDGYGVAYDLTAIQAALGDLPAACAALEHAIKDHSLTLLWLRHDPRMDALRGEPCYARVARQLYGEALDSK